MAKDKITVVGAGNVGATTAFIAATRHLGEIVLIDIVKGLAEGKALDMAQASPIQWSQQTMLGTTDWAAIAGSEVVIIACGIPPQTRDESRRPVGHQHEDRPGRQP